MNTLLYLAVVLIWGTTWLAIGLQQGPVAPTVSIFYRFALAAGLMMLGLALSGRLKALAARDHLWCLAQGFCVFGFNFYCFYHAAAYLSTGMEAVLFSMAVLYNAANGVLFFRQPLEGRLLAAALLGMAGICSLFWPELRAAQWSPELLKGIGLCLLGTYGFSLGNLISARHQRLGLDLLSTNGYAMSYGALLMGALALAQGLPFNLDPRPAYLGALLYLAVVGSVLGFWAYFRLVGRVGASRAAYSTLLFPLVALALSTFFEGYQWHPKGVLGLALILAGNLVMFPAVLARLKPWLGLGARA
ncbi:DMT family transporter [Gallaecimonas xiamenensis]|uniref:Putative inner membrane protein n=1 Tax=Gallaecimonas xiamenensis 3-C-1 TaxID=745411 RepID=K2K2E1_9GAMM|nr:DMT family transporter [Gallaecimonas xiamenensis]EKE71645.1 putative inner membrane protein [Gallaecimonas xiamenensis 3-C-1]